jgi:CBS domain-containing protein
MLTRGRRGAVVIVEGRRPVGILSERDVLYRFSEKLLNSSAARRMTSLRELMTDSPLTVRRQVMLEGAVALMAEHECRHLVVVDGKGELRGLLTTPDIVQYVTDHFPEATINLPPRLRQRFRRPEGG